MAEQEPIIIKKVKGKGGGHHGGAWKVAYADFVTALVALFIVLWIIGQSEEVKKAVEAYFNDPVGFSKAAASRGLMPGQEGVVKDSGISKKIVTKAIAPKLKKYSPAEKRQQAREAAREKLENALQGMPLAEKLKDQIRVELYEDKSPGKGDQSGIRVEFQDKEGVEFFKTGSSSPSPEFREILDVLTKELQDMPSNLVVEGYTDSRPFVGRQDYTNWNLSCDRADAVRKILENEGLGKDRVKEIRGYADNRLADPEHPESARNRRVSVLIMMK
ncbi:MAG: OmpA family protein [Deltaproteobacteria bacterium]|nr:OmpA family protein [Deltaproteobacteria bacterium]